MSRATWRGTNERVIAAAVQFRAPKGRPAETRQALASWLDRATAEGAGLVVFPELATTGYIWESPEELAPHAEPAQGPTFEALAPLAAERGAWVVCGFPERDEHGRLYNSALVIDGQGQLVACYRKVLLFEADKPWALPGDTRMLIRTPFGVLMPAICMDINDDGLIRALARHQPDVLAFPTSWVEEGMDVHGYWRARLRTFRGVMVAADNWGEDRGTTFAGRSAVLGAGGVLAQRGPEGDGLALAELPIRAPASSAPA